MRICEQPKAQEDDAKATWRRLSNITVLYNDGRLKLPMHSNSSFRVERAQRFKLLSIAGLKLSMSTSRLRFLPLFNNLSCYTAVIQHDDAKEHAESDG